MFEDRIDAAQQLTTHVEKYRRLDSVILSIPRGGVPIGHYIAEGLDVPLDVVLTKKIGHPLHKELAIGAVSLHGRIIDNQFTIPENYIEEETERIRKDLQRKYEMYRGQRKAVDLKGKHLILVDDGIATGITMLATIQLVLKNNPTGVTVAVPVSSVSAKELLEPEVDEYISLLTPHNFGAVSQYYQDYQQVSDEEVIALLH